MKKPDSKQINITIDSATIFRIFAVVLAILLILSFINDISKPLVLIFISFFLALALNPAVGWISERLKNRSRIRATGAAYLTVITILIGFIILVVPPILNQTLDFVRHVPNTLEEVKNENTAVGRFVTKYNLQSEVDQLASEVSNKFKVSDAAQPVLSTAGAVGATVVSIITVFVLTFMMLVEGPAWLDRFWALQPKHKRHHRREIAGKMYRVVTGYVNGQLLIALIGGTFTFAALVISSNVYNVSVNTVALAGIVTMFALLPLIGTTLGASIVVLASIFVSVPLAITMAIFFVVYQQIENVTIQPLIQSKKSNMTPLMVFLAAIIGVSAGGVLGALVAVPIAGIIKVLIEDKYQNSLSPED